MPICSSRKGKVDSAGGMLLETRRHPSNPPDPAPSITVDGIEVVQVVQDMGNTVTLIAGKSTLVRAYLSTAGSAPLSVRGVLAARPVGAGVWTQIPSTGSVILNPADIGSAGLRRKRETLDLSLNFLLPPSLLTGNVEVALSQVERLNPVVTLTVPPGASQQVNFRPAATLRIQVIGIRYQAQLPGASPRSHEPAAIDYSLIRSWLARAYPVALIDWSQTVVDWHGQNAWPTDDNSLAVWGKNEVNPYLSSLRTQDVAAGTDHRTHYFGLAADSAGFMRGWAAGIPSKPDPSVVASGPAGVPVGTFAWDTDGSYADWYTGHELAHTFGRSHPGFCNGNSRDDLDFPYPNGQIAHNDGDFVGYDVGDPVHAIGPQALPGTVWHDVMTYCDRQWLSPYTYEGIYSRLTAEDSLAPGASALDGPQAQVLNHAMVRGSVSSQTDGIHIVARVNQTTNTGQFRFVTPVATIANAGQAPASQSDYAIRVRRADETTTEYPAAFRRDVGGDPADPANSVTGSLDVIVPNDKTVVALELIHNDAVLATFTPGVEPTEPENIQVAASSSGPSFKEMASVSSHARPKIIWTSSDMGGPRAAALKVGPSIKYTVQLSADGGLSWRTIGVGLVTPEVTIDPQLLVGQDTVQVRVTATNGFTTKTTTQTLTVKDL
jgi:hypothetical protein